MMDRATDSPRALKETGRTPFSKDGSELFQNSPLFPNGFGTRDWSIADEDYRLLRNAVLELLDLDLNDYRTQQMERRLTTLLERRRADSWSAYVDALRRDAGELEYFQEFITINVSSFYRDAEKWTFLDEQILPDLLARRAPLGISGWSVGCSIGAEAYTLAMLLAQKGPMRRHSIWATDIDARVLERARAGGPYFPNEVRELPASLRSTFMTPVSGQLVSVKPTIRASVEFDRFNLLKDEPTRKFDLVMCRNVVIYFTPETKLKVYRRLARACKPGSILFIGSTETISNYQQLGFQYVAPSFYRYVGG